MSDRYRARVSSDNRVLAWLADAGGDLPEDLRETLLAQLTAAPIAIVAGSVTSMVVISASLTIHPIRPLFVIAALELVILGLRLWTISDIKRAYERHATPRVDYAMVLSIVWCALQGSLAFVLMRTNVPALMVLAATLSMGIIGPICARNYPAPRLAMLLVALCSVPFVTGGAFSANHWLIVLLPMTPPFLLGALQVVMTFNKVLVSALVAEARSHYLAHHDPLTGLLNRHGLDVALHDIVATQNWVFSILCIDLDGFKQVNDSHGHGAGDMLLQGVGERLTRNTRAGDIVARIGGDEFLIVVRNLEPEAIARTAERLIGAISDKSYAIGGSSVRVGASIGYACFPEDAADVPDLRLRADNALYAAKRAGKGVRRRYDAQSVAA